MSRTSFKKIILNSEGIIYSFTAGFTKKKTAKTLNKVF